MGNVFDAIHKNLAQELWFIYQTLSYHMKTFEQ